MQHGHLFTRRFFASMRQRWGSLGRGPSFRAHLIFGVFSQACDRVTILPQHILGLRPLYKKRSPLPPQKSAPLGTHLLFARGCSWGAACSSAACTLRFASKGLLRGPLDARTATFLRNDSLWRMLAQKRRGVGRHFQQPCTPISCLPSFHITPLADPPAARALLLTFFLTHFSYPSKSNSTQMFYRLYPSAPCLLPSVFLEVSRAFSFAHFPSNFVYLQHLYSYIIVIINPRTAASQFCWLAAWHHRHRSHQSWALPQPTHC